MSHRLRGARENAPRRPAPDYDPDAGVSQAGGSADGPRRTRRFSARPERHRRPSTHALPVGGAQRARILSMSTDRDLLSGTPAPEDLGVEVTLRPQQLQDYIGQERVVDNLKVFIR